MNNLQIFNFENSEVRTVMLNGEPWFVAKDVTNILDLSNPSMAVNRLDEDERSKFNLGRQGETNIVNEFGLYQLVLGSRKPEAKQFKRWITHEVIPSIRKTGSYSVAANPMDALRLMFEATEQTQQQVKNVSDRVQTLEEDTLLSSSEYNYITKQLNRKVMEFVSMKNLEGNDDAKKLLFKDVNTGVHAITGVRIRAHLKNRHFSDVVDYLRDWIPSKSTLMLIEKMENGL